MHSLLCDFQELSLREDIPLVDLWHAQLLGYSVHSACIRNQKPADMIPDGNTVTRT